MRKIWTMALATCLIGLATAAMLNAQPQDQEPPASANPPDQAAPPNGRPGRGGNIESRLELMSKQLNLTDEQREKIRPILKHEVELIRAVRGNNNLTQREARRRIQTIRRNSRQKVAEVLTPEQRKQWEEIRQEHAGGGGGQRPSEPPAPPNTN